MPKRSESKPKRMTGQPVRIASRAATGRTFLDTALAVVDGFLGLPPGSMPLGSAVTWAFVPRRLASSAGIRHLRRPADGLDKRASRESEPFHGCPAPSVAVHLPRWTASVGPQVSLRNTDSPGGEPSTRQSLRSAVRAPGVGDEGGPSSPTTLPVSPASLGGSQGHAPDLLKNDSGAGPVTASSLATVKHRPRRWPRRPQHPGHDQKQDRAGGVKRSGGRGPARMLESSASEPLP
jgi:hypothetical protein